MKTIKTVSVKTILIGNRPYRQESKEVANKTKKTAAKDDANVVRIKATSSPATKRAETTEPAAKVVAKAAKTKTETPKKAKKTGSSGKKVSKGLRASGGYFKGAWTELRQVRWPNRRATWSMTGAVIAFSAFFVVFVLLLDAGFKYLFDFILKK